MAGLGTAVATNDVDRGPALLAVAVTTTILAFSASILRYCIKSRINRSIAWDDYFIGLAHLVGLVGICFTIVESVSSFKQTSVEFDYLAQPWLMMGATLSKVSICLFVLRLVFRVNVWRKILGVMIVFLLVVNVAYTCTTLLQCRPLEALWNSSVHGQCWGIETQQAIGYLEGAFDVFADLFIAFFPVMVVQDLRIQRALRWPFYGLSAMSIGVAIISIIRTYNISLVKSPKDQYQMQIICTILAVLDLNLNILAANILPLASLSSPNIRPISQAVHDAAEARDSDTASILSKASRSSKFSRMTKATNRLSTGSSILIQGPHRESYLGESSRGTSEPSGEAWPMGIIKTISFDIVQEDAVDTEHGLAKTYTSPAKHDEWD